MPDEYLPVNASTLDLKSVLKELEVPFSSYQVQWRVTNTTKDRKRGQVVPYADARAYADRLNALFTPQGWTREYRVETVGNITRMKGGESIVTGKILVTCTVTIVGLWSHSGTGEEWADDSNAMTAADAQAFKRACSCFGLGRYLYEFHGLWVDLDQNQQPKQMPVLAGWAIPENWRNGSRPPGINGNGDPGQGSGSNGNGHNGPKANGRKPGPVTNSADRLDTRIMALEKTVGTRLYRSVLREYGKAEHPSLIKDAEGKQKVLQVLESAVRGVHRLNAVKKRVDPKVLEGLLAKVQAPPLAEIGNMRTLRDVVLGLEQLAGSPPVQA